MSLWAALAVWALALGLGVRWGMAWERESHRLDAEIARFLDTPEDF